MSKDKRRKEREPVNRPVIVGDTVMRRPVTFGQSEKGAPKQTRGAVVYVHPRGRFHVVEFARGIRESFFGVMLLEGGGAVE